MAYALVGRRYRLVGGLSSQAKGGGFSIRADEDAGLWKGRSSLLPQMLFEFSEAQTMSEDAQGR